MEVRKLWPSQPSQGGVVLALPEREMRPAGRTRTRSCPEDHRRLSTGQHTMGHQDAIVPAVHCDGARRIAVRESDVSMRTVK